MVVINYLVEHLRVGAKVVRRHVPDDEVQIICGFKLTNFENENTQEVTTDAFCILSGGGYWPSYMLKVVDND